MERNVPKLRFKGFNDEWEEYRIGDLCRVDTGNKDTQNKVDNGIYPFFVRSQNVERINTYSYDGEAILTAGDGVGVGKVFHYVNCKFDYHQRVYKLSDFNNVNGKFLYMYFSKNFKRETVKYNAKTTVDSVRREMITKMKIIMPSMVEQERIANFLTKVDKIIEKQEEKVKNLEKYKKGMMQKIFSQEIRFKDENGEDYPEWEELTFNDILVEDLYPVPKPSEKYEKISVRSHAKGTFSSIVDKPEEVNMDTLYEVKEKQLIVNITFAWEHAIAIVKKEDENKLVSHRFPTYKFKENANYEFYGNYIKLPIVKYKLSLASPGGAGRNRVLNKKEFLKIEVPVPCIDEQMKIAKFLSDIDNIAEKEQKKLEKMRVWKKGLLQQMFV